MSQYAIDGEMSEPYIDTHVHFWNNEAFSYSWLESEPRLAGQFGLEDYRRATAYDRPSGFVFVQAAAVDSDGADEASWVHEMCKSSPDFAGIVAWAPVDKGPNATRDHLEALDVPSIVGVRRLLQWDPPGLARQPRFVAAVDALAGQNLTFDICIFPEHLEDAQTLAASCPNTRLVLDHLGKPNIAGGEIHMWKAGFCALARHDNVWCKLSGLATEASPDWTPSDVAPYVDVALDTFGPERLIWGSDWPICTVATSHEVWRRATELLLSELAPSERHAILVGNATRVYHRQDVR
jgi:L-fuconolactonase